MSPDPEKIADALGGEAVDPFAVECPQCLAPVGAPCLGVPLDGVPHYVRVRKAPSTYHVNRYSRDGFFVGHPATHKFIDAQRYDGAWAFFVFMPRPMSAKDAAWFARALAVAVEESEGKSKPAGDLQPAKSESGEKRQE